MNTSIIISTFNREKNIFEILKLLNKQIITYNKIEILICDSNSNKKLSILNYKFLFKKLNIKYFNINQNHQAAKRNFGLKKALFSNIILIDDDCYPCNKFIAHHLKKLKLKRSKEIYCGTVKYYKSYKNYNLVKYRDSRLITLSSKKKNHIPPKNFISMNMSFRKTLQNKNQILFDPRFKHYGFEDFEFAYRLQSKFCFILIDALIMHKDNRDFKKFLLKYYNLGKFGLNDIINININAAKVSIYYKIDHFPLNKILKKSVFVNKFLLILELLLIKLEKKFKFPFIIYNASLAISFLRGSNERSIQLNSTNKELNEWYE